MLYQGEPCPPFGRLRIPRKSPERHVVSEVEPSRGARNKNILLKIPEGLFTVSLHYIVVDKRLWGNSSRILKIRSGHGPLPLCFTLSSRLVLPCKTARAKQSGRGSEGFSQASLPAGRQAKPRWGFASPSTLLGTLRKALSLSKGGPARIAPKPFVYHRIT